MSWGITIKQVDGNPPPSDSLRKLDPQKLQGAMPLLNPVKPLKLGMERGRDPFRTLMAKTKEHNTKDYRLLSTSKQTLFLTGNKVSKHSPVTRH